MKNQLINLFERFAVDEDNNNLNLQDMVCETISSIISEVDIDADQKLPSCRELSKTLKVSRNTVNAAYMQLIDAGLIESRERSGYFISSTWKKQNPIQSEGTYSTSSPLPIALQDSFLSNLDNPVQWQDYSYPFTYNQIDPMLFPLDSWRECARTVLGKKHTLDWIRDSVDTDSSNLISQIRKRLLTSRGIVASEDEIMITTGSQ